MTSSEKVRFGLVGTGNSGKNIAQAMVSVEEVELVAIASGHLENARALADKHGVEVATGEYGELLERVDIDAVCVTVPHGLHHPIAMDVLGAGKHLLLEKPMAVTLEQCDEIIAKAREVDLRLGVFFQKRFSQTMLKMREVVQNEIGRVFHADVYVKWFRDRDYYEKSPWRGTWAMEGGGCLMNQASHQIDLLAWLMGPVKSITGHIQTVGHDIEVEDVATAVLEFESGATGTVTGSTAVVPGFPAEVAVHGTGGTVRLVGDDLFVYKPGDKPDKPPEGGASYNNFSDPTTFAVGEHQALIRDFARSVLENRNPKVDGVEGRKAVEIITGIYQSSKEGKTLLYNLDNP
ncbi:MAG: Gfo/Idh/MocA family protein [Promethearchaeota archaeon]